MEVSLKVILSLKSIALGYPKESKLSRKTYTCSLTIGMDRPAEDNFDAICPCRNSLVRLR